MTKSDLTELAALNRQIAELRSVLSALLPRVDWLLPFDGIPPYRRKCFYCPEYMGSNGDITHADYCPYRRAKELAADADSPPSGSR